jgi:hypothetical protein
MLGIVVVVIGMGKVLGGDRACGERAAAGEPEPPSRATTTRTSGDGRPPWNDFEAAPPPRSGGTDMQLWEDGGGGMWWVWVVCVVLRRLVLRHRPATPRCISAAHCAAIERAASFGGIDLWFVRTRA